MMNDTNDETSQMNQQNIPFKAETRQILDILIHSLYTEREIFLRELISNASDALTRMNFELLTNREVFDADQPLEVHVIPDETENTLTISDTGIGMTAPELTENLGTIAQSGARAFIEAAEAGEQDISNIIGQFGVGFYSAFMVADWIKVTSRSYQPGAEAAAWYSIGVDSFSVESAEKNERGTSVVITLKEDASEFTKEARLKEIIKRHSDFVPFPIYLGDQEEQVNQQTALWRQSPREVEKEKYEEFYRQLTLDFEPPTAYAHMVVDAPVQMYALLFIPTSSERRMFSLRKEEGLKLYSRKVLIQEYCKDLLPEYYAFVQGVVDSEDLPLNISRETVQSSKVMATLKKLVTSKITSIFKDLADKDKDKYEKVWKEFSRFFKQGVAIEQNEPEKLYPLLRFRTTTNPERWSSLDDYIERMQIDQKEIFYIMGNDDRSVIHSPHLDVVRAHKYEALLMTDPLDAFMLVRLKNYQDHPLQNVASADLSMPEEPIEGEDQQIKPTEQDFTNLIDLFRDQLGDQVAAVRLTDRLVDSPARLVDPEGTLDQEIQYVYRYLDKDFEIPKKTLELNPRHPIIKRLNELSQENPLFSLIITQIYEDALLIEGLHPDPAGMITRIQEIIEAALD
jgi:molecular chaperone HtpG